MSFTKITEQDSLYNNLESKSVRELLDDINTEDQKVASAVRKTIPKVEELVLQIVPRMSRHKWTSGRTRCFGDPPYFRNAANLGDRTDCGWRQSAS